MSELLYEDKLAKAFLAPNAATNGHIHVQPQKAAKQLSELSPEESAHLLLVASYTAAILFQGLQAEGTNIILNEEEEQLTVHVIARKSGDNLDFAWQPAQLDAAALADAEERIKEKTFYLGQDVEEQPQEAESTKEEDVAAAEEYEEMLIKQLHRIP